ncbi:hypothetical protein SUGI_0279840 [Cryptomeria japonica]|uniref:uncharacterized protein LOC131075699 n=1 Tax=Cryptomeria japonica TaxID=3369 RepID=UPI002408D505|nr:uncharacterized protein LOC131075699 [Cryptomeria japonica]GLJ16445.1 hypothetical protein SUGI_0279840 [Cryptomeria japonica]
MGSYLSCASSILPSDTVKVVLVDGSVKEFERGAKVAEVMLENPHHFVCNRNCLEVGRRIEPLSADYDLQVKERYVVFPISKLRSALSPSDMVSSTNKTSHNLSPNNKICHSDKIEEFSVQPKMNLEEFEEVKCRLYRVSWKPKLESIREFHVRG